MVKSAAEKMREYRKRLKEDPNKYEDYLAKAKRRKKENYVPVNQLSNTEKKRRREKVREYVYRHRLKKKMEDAEVQRNTNMSESGYDTQESSGPMIINLPFPNRQNGPRKRVSRALSKKHKELKELKSKFQHLEKKYKSSLRNLQRLKKKQREHTISNASVTEPFLTPRRKTEQVMIGAGLDKKQRCKIRKQLLFANVVKTHVDKCRKGVKRTEVGILRGLIGGKILSKYRLAREVNKSTGLGRNRIAKAVSGVYNAEKRRRKREIEKYRSRVMDFLVRDDNSRCNPGKQDKMKVNGDTHQTRILTDYLKNLHFKFLGENPDVKLSFASFCRIRPPFLKLTRFISRSCCLCTRHQNFALCTSSMRKCGVNVPLNPETFIEDTGNTEKMKTDLPEEIEFGQWKRVPLQDKGKTKMIMKVVSSTMTKEKFLQYMEQQITDFTQHVQRVWRQYAESLKIKKNLTVDEVVVIMDFAENYSCKSVNEIQSAYWNQNAVTLHPVVFYYKESGEELHHKSMVIVSDEMGHNSSTVLTFIDKVVPEVQKCVPRVKKIHYYTDSPTSQYRNKTIFRVVANHEEIYGCRAVWNYFEAGHGKGPCDGLGGTTKRLADEAVRSGKVTIQDGEEFYQWCQSPFCSLKNVHFLYVPSTECQLKADHVNQYDIKPIKGTMKIHAVVGKGADKILSSTVSCYCTDCINDKECKSNQWTSESLIVSKKSISASSEKKVEDTSAESGPTDLGNTSPRRELVIGDYVAAVYDKKTYIGKITDFDNDDGEVEITFMENVRKLLQWPKHEDKIWIEKTAIMCSVSEPIPTGKSRRMFKLADSDIANIGSKK